MTSKLRHYHEVFNNHAELFDYITDMMGWLASEKLDELLEHTTEQWINRGNNFQRKEPS